MNVKTLSTYRYNSTNATGSMYVDYLVVAAGAGGGARHAGGGGAGGMLFGTNKVVINNTAITVTVG